MTWHLRDSRNVAVIAAGLAASCGQDPTETRAPERSASDQAVQPAYSTEELDNVLAGVADARQRVVAGITEEATARAVQDALSRLETELASNNPIRIRLAIDHSLEILERFATSEKALEDAAELESVKLLLSNAAEFLPVQMNSPHEANEDLKR